MKRSNEVYIEDVLESIGLIRKYAANVTGAGFIGDPELQDAIMRRLEIIGETVKHVPEKIRNEFPKIPWREISSMREMLKHEYFGKRHEKTFLIWKGR